MHNESSSPENQIPKSEIEVTGAGGGAADDESINLSTRTTKSESDGLMSPAPPFTPSLMQCIYLTARRFDLLDCRGTPGL